jgi:uncharacterized membrane protein YfcA
VTLDAAILPATGVGMVGGLLVGLTGVGAGSVIAALLLVFYPGVAAQIIVGSATVQAVVMKLSGVWARRQFQLNERKMGVAMAAGAIPLAVAGAWASSLVPGASLRIAMAVVLLGVGVHLVVQSIGTRWRHLMFHPAGSDPSPREVGFVGALVGFVAGLTSVGTGTLFVSALVGPLAVSAHRAVGVALFAGLLTLVVSGATHAVLGHVDPALVLGACLGSVPGVLFGTALSRRLEAPALRGVVGGGIVIASLVSLGKLLLSW